MTDRLPIPGHLRARIVERAREFRKEPTTSETLLWEVLRGSRRGVRFRRQQPIGPFIVEFFCPAHCLIIEVDGPVHDVRLDADQERQSLVEACGYRVLRFTSDQVERDLSQVITRIDVAIEEQRTPGTSPPLPGEGEGAGG